MKHQSNYKTNLKNNKIYNDHSGSVAIEFAVILPILVLLLIGLIEFRSGFLVKQRTVIAATTMSNIIAEIDEINSTTIDQLKSVAEEIIYPLSTSKIDVSVAIVTSYELKIIIEQEFSSGDVPIDEETVDELLSGIIMVGETAIISKINVIHEPVILSSFFNVFEFDSKNVVYSNRNISNESNI